MRPRRTVVLGVAATVVVLAIALIGALVLGRDSPTDTGAASASSGGPSTPVGSSSGAPTSDLAPSTGPAVDPSVPAGALDPRTPQDRLGPVLLVPGYGGGKGGLLVLADLIRATGRDAEVLTLPGNGTGDLGEQMAVLDRAADDAVTAGAPSVDVIGFSAGGLVAGLWVARSDGADHARRVVSLGSPLHGTHLAAVGAENPDACPAACRQMVPGSTLLAELHTAAIGTRVPWLSLWTARDEVVTPPESSRLDGALNVEVQSLCPGSTVTHGLLPTDPLVTTLVLHALTSGPLIAPPTPPACPPTR